ncbi:hypothetical protein QNI16_33930 [Cytophagaceae bacterium YF14B1]|uniref:Uncharacterized protein n=1 Tax=Xanthocytophaga flava TaxID=3048013 RepID=A0AAE3QXU0_9BACT|nr:hypothetical protein [Xanthocytophaga flavus]MDJ1485540.1 hypothetical protein [Xanthocytophaga flavus]
MTSHEWLRSLRITAAKPQSFRLHRTKIKTNLYSDIRHENFYRLGSGKRLNGSSLT